MQQLERALGRARIAIAETEIGIDDADQVELGEMVTLGDQLGADDDVEAALGDVVEFLAQALHRFHQIAGQHQDARVGKQLGRLLLQPLDAGADRRERVGRLAFRALLRRRHREAAMMADEPAPEAMIDQPGVAVRAGEPKPQARQSVSGAKPRRLRNSSACSPRSSAVFTASASRGAMKRPRGGPSRLRSIASMRRQMLAAEALRQMQRA